jgi:hypothetical protein
MLREAGRNPERGLPLLIANAVLAMALLVVVFGVSALVIPAMIAVPVMFYLLLSLGVE